jgi:hypothetical protein
METPTNPKDHSRALSKQSRRDQAHPHPLLEAQAWGLGHRPRLPNNDSPSQTSNQCPPGSAPGRQQRPEPQARSQLRNLSGTQNLTGMEMHPESDKYEDAPLSARSTTTRPYWPLSRQGHTMGVTL